MMNLKLEHFLEAVNSFRRRELAALRQENCILRAQKALVEFWNREPARRRGRPRKWTAVLFACLLALACHAQTNIPASDSYVDEEGVGVCWNHIFTNAAGFNLYMATNNGAYAKTDMGQATMICYWNLPGGCAYHWRTAAYNSNGVETAISAVSSWTNYLYTPTNLLVLFNWGTNSFVTNNPPGTGFACVSNNLLIFLKGATQPYLGTNKNRTLIPLKVTSTLQYQRTP